MSISDDDLKLNCQRWAAAMRADLPGGVGFVVMLFRESDPGAVSMFSNVKGQRLRSVVSTCLDKLSGRSSSGLVLPS